VNTLLKEFEASLGVCEKTWGEMVKKSSASTDLANKLNQQQSENKEKEDNSKKIADDNAHLKTKEKELVEVIGELETKSQSIEKALNEIQNKANNKSGINGSGSSASHNQELVDKKKRVNMKKY